MSYADASGRGDVGVCGTVIGGGTRAARRRSLALERLEGRLLLSTTIYAADMSTDPGWTAEGEWEWGQAVGGGSHNQDPTSGYTGDNIYGYNLGGDYPDNLPATNLTTQAIDCSGHEGVQLEFYRWLGVESSGWDHASVLVSNDGATWTTAWDHMGSNIADSHWRHQQFDISAVADNQSTVYVRWVMGPTDFSVTYPGWNIDDVRLFTGEDVPNAPPTVDLTGLIAELPENTDTTSPIKVADIVVTDDGVGTNELFLGGADYSMFEIVGSELFLGAGQVLDASANPRLDVTVAVDDPELGDMHEDTAWMSIDVTVANEPPTLDLEERDVLLSHQSDTTGPIAVADILVHDDGLGVNNLSLSGEDAGLFEIAGTELRLVAGADLAGLSSGVLDVTVSVDDPAVGTTPDDSEDMALMVAVGVVEEGDMRVSFYDLDGPLDVSMEDIDVKFGRPGEIRKIQFGGDQGMGGLGIVIRGADEVGKIKDQRKDPLDIAFIGSEASIGKLQLRSGMQGFNLSGVTIEGRTAPDDLDEDGDQTDATAVVVDGHMGKFQAGGTVHGDVLVWGADDRGRAARKVQVKDGGYHGDMVLAGDVHKVQFHGDFGSTLTVEGDMKKLQVKGGDISGEIEVGGQLRKLDVKARRGTGGSFHEEGRLDVGGVAGGDAPRRARIHGDALGKVRIQGDFSGIIHAGGNLKKCKIDGSATGGSLYVDGSMRNIKVGGSSLGGNFLVDGDLSKFVCKGDFVDSDIEAGGLGRVNISGEVYSNGSPHRISTWGGEPFKLKVGREKYDILDAVGVDLSGVHAFTGHFG